MNKWLRLVAIMGVVFGLTGLVGCASAPSETTEKGAKKEGAAAAKEKSKETAPEKKAEKQPAGTKKTAEEKKTKELLEKANAAYEEGDYLQADALYKKIAEAGGEVPKRKVRKAERKTKKLYGEAQQLLQDAGAALEKNQPSEAAGKIEELKGTVVFKSDKDIRQTAEALEKKIVEATKAKEAQEEKIEGLLAKANAAYEKGNYPEASGLYDEVVKAGGEPPRKKSRKAEKLTKKFYAEAEKLLAEVRKALKNKKSAEAAEKIEELKGTNAFKFNKDLREATASLEKKVVELQEAKSEREKKIEGLLAKANAAYEKRNYPEASGLYDEVVKAGGEPPRKKSRKAEKLTKKFYAEAEKLLGQAKNALENNEPAEAAEKIEELKETNAFKFKEDLQETVADFEKKVLEAQKAKAAREKKINDLLQKANAAYENENYPQARALYKKVGEAGGEVPKGKARKANRLTKKLYGNVQELLSEAEAALENMQPAKAAQRIETVKETPAFKSNKDVREAALALEKKIGQTKKEMESQEKKATSLLNTAREALLDRELQRAQKAVDEAKKLPIVKHRAQLGSEISRLSEQLAATRSNLDKQRKQVESALQAARRSMEKWNLNRAERLVQVVLRTPGIDTFPQLKKDADALQKQLQASADKKKQQRQQAEELVKTAEKTVGNWQFGKAQDTLVRVKNLDIYKAIPEIQRQVAQIEENMASEKKRARKFNKQVVSALEEAEKNIKYWELDKAASIIAKAEKSPAARKDKEVARKVASLKETLQKTRKNIEQKKKGASSFLGKAEEARKQKKYKESASFLDQATKTSAYRNMPDLQEDIAQHRIRLAEAAVKNNQFAIAAEVIGSIKDGPVYERDKTIRTRTRALDKQTIEQQKQVARNVFQEAREAYGEKDYVAAKKLLKKAAAIDSGIGVLPGSKLRKMQKEVDSTLAKCAKLYEEGQRFYKMGNFTAARGKFKKIQEMGVQCGPEIEGGVERCMADMEAKIVAQKMGEAERLAQAAERVEKKQENALEEITKRKEKLAKKFDEIRQMQKKGQLLKAEKKLNEAVAYTQERKVALTDKQQLVKAKVERQIEKKYGRSREQKAERYASLVKIAEDYADMGNWQQSLELLNAVKEARHCPLSQKDRKSVETKLEWVKTNAEKQAKVIKQAETLANRGQELSKKNKGREALTRCEEAYMMVKEAQIPAGKLVSVLKSYEAVASKAWPSITKEEIQRLKKPVDQQVSEAVNEQNYMLARVYVRSGSWDAAEPLLKKAAANKALDEDNQKWAQQQLQGIKERVKGLQRKELIATKKEAQQISVVGQKFEAASEKGPPAEVKRLSRELNEARIERLEKRVEMRLDRAAYPEAQELLAESKELVSRAGAKSQIRKAQERVQRWKQTKKLVSEATAALKSGEPQKATTALAKVRNIKLAQNPYSEVIGKLQEAARGLVAFRRAKTAKEQRQKQSLQQIRRMLARARQRGKVLDIMAEAFKAYAEGNWGDVHKQVTQLGEDAPLYDFEREKMVTVERRQRKQSLLTSIYDSVEERDFVSASKAIEEARGSRIYKQDKTFRRRVSDMKDRIKKAEDRAAELYAEAQKAYKQDRIEKLKDLLRELKENYKNTRVFAEKM
ncbi:MAG: hypothetical protein ACLFWL_11990 [Candidatus Brocadiia bacterium]